MHEIQRRALLKGAAAGALAFSVDGVDVLLTPRAARAQDVPLRTLSAGQAETLDAVGETLMIATARPATKARSAVPSSRRATPSRRAISPASPMRGSTCSGLSSPPS